MPGAAGGLPHPLAEEIRLRAAIALPLQPLQGGDLALVLPLTVGQLEGSLPCSVRALPAAGDVHQLGELTCQAVRQPQVTG
jgi:hypothetical protein